jgi:hypothetical protein
MQLTEQERQDLRREMLENAMMMKDWLRKKRVREQQEAEAPSSLPTVRSGDETPNA